MKLVPPNSIYASSIRTTASGAALLMRARSSIGINCPVGLFGVFRKIMRVRGVTASMTCCVGNAKLWPGGTRMAVAPTAAVELGYGSNAGQRNDGFGVVHALARDVPDGSHQDPFIEPVGEEHAVGIDAEVRGQSPRHGTTDMSTRRTVACVEWLEHGRAAAGVLIEMQPEALARVGVTLYHHHFILTPIESACAAVLRPSQRHCGPADPTQPGASHALTVNWRTKSAADSLRVHERHQQRAARFDPMA